MDRTEQNIIDELFEKLSKAERGSTQRDAGAERHINSLISRQPSAPYYMAQAIIVQEQALKQAQQRIGELENDVDDRPADGGGSFLGGLFGGGSVPRSGGGATSGSRYPAQNRGREDESPVAQYQRTGQGGGFLAGAAQTAIGVAGGVLLGNMLGGMFGGGGKVTATETAKTEDANKEQPANNDQNDNNADTQDVGNDGGGWFDGGGDFDI